MKTKVDKLNIDKFVPAPVDLSKLIDVVKNDGVKKDVYYAKIKNVENKIPGITDLATNTTLDVKINEVKNKITKISDLTTTSALTAVESKISNISNLIRKSDYNTNINEIENKITTDHDYDKYITTQEFNKLTWANIPSRLAQANLASKIDIANFVKKTCLDDQLKKLNKNFTSNKTKHVLAENELNRLSKKIKSITTKGLSKDLIKVYKTFNVAKYFLPGIFQRSLVFIPAKKYIENLTKSNRNFPPIFLDRHVLPNINFNGHCLINNNISTPKKLINL